MKKLLGLFVGFFVVFNIAKQALQTNPSETQGHEPETNIYEEGTKQGLKDAYEVGGNILDGVIDFVQENGADAVDEAIKVAPSVGDKAIDLTDKALRGLDNALVRGDSIMQTDEFQSNIKDLKNKASEAWNNWTSGGENGNSNKSANNNDEPDTYTPTRDY